MKILVTGATGYIGSHLIRYLAKNEKYTVYALVRPSSQIETLTGILHKDNIFKVTLTIESMLCAVGQAMPDVVIHTAASTIVSHLPEEVKSIVNSNILFGTLLLEVMAINRITRFINTGTFWEYMDGQEKYRPVNLYAASKRAFENIVRYYEDAHGISSVTLKLYGTYGPYDNRGKIFSLFKESVESKKQLLLTLGEQVMDFVYIDDVVSAYGKTISYILKKKHCSSETFFIGTGEGFSLRRLVAIYGECIGKSLNVKWGGKPYRKREVMYSVADKRPAKTILGWKPKYDLKKGITKMLEAEKGN